MGNLKEAERRTVNNWIRTADKVPDKQIPVLVYVPPHINIDNEEYTGYVGLAYYTHTGNGGYWCGTDGNVYGAIGMIHAPTHWMPLPEAPDLTLEDIFGDEPDEVQHDGKDYVRYEPLEAAAQVWGWQGGGLLPAPIRDRSEEKPVADCKPD